MLACCGGGGGNHYTLGNYLGTVHKLEHTDPTFFLSFFWCLVCAFLVPTHEPLRAGPSSVVAVAQEVTPPAPIFKMVIGVTVMSDVVVLIGFALLSALASSLCPTPGPNGYATEFDGLSLVVLLSQFGGIALVGFVMGIVLLFILWIPFVRFSIFGAVKIYRSHMKGALIIPLGFLIFRALRGFSSATLAAWGREISIEPLMVCMIASSIAGHTSGNREQFANILEKTAPYIFLPFFTLTGASLQLDKVIGALPLALTVVALRMTAIFMGLWAEETCSCSQYNGLRWLCGCRKGGCCGKGQQGKNGRNGGSGGNGGNGGSGREGGMGSGGSGGSGGSRGRSGSCSSPLSEASTMAPMLTPRKELRLDEPLLNHVSDDHDHDGDGDHDHDGEYKQAEGSSLTALDLAAKENREERQSFQVEVPTLDLEHPLKNKWFWIGTTMMSQAGVALGLAFETEDRFKKWGGEFSTLILSIVVINQVLGPPLCKIGFLMLGGDGGEEQAREEGYVGGGGDDGDSGGGGGGGGGLTVDIVTVGLTPSEVWKDHSSSSNNNNNNNNDDDILRALSRPDTRVRVIQQAHASSSSSSPTAVPPSLPSPGTSPQVSSGSLRRMASAYSMLGPGTPRRRTSSSVTSLMSALSSPSHPRRVLDSVGSDEEAAGVMLQSPQSLLVLSRSPSRTLVRDISALRERREGKRQ